MDLEETKRDRMKMMVWLTVRGYNTAVLRAEPLSKVRKVFMGLYEKENKPSKKICVAVMLALMLLTPNMAMAGNVVDVAISQIGKGEIGGNNKGPEVKKFTRGIEAAWCAGLDRDWET